MDINTQELNANYNYHKAKLNSSLKWIVSKCNNESFPIFANEEFENEDDDEISILDKYSFLEENLCNGSLYREVMLNIFSDSEKYITSNDFTAMIQWLLRKGIEIKDCVKNEHLHQKPINEEAHLSFINSIMKALNFRIFAIEKVVKAVRRFTTFSPSSELPLNLESTIYFWVNKVILFYIRSLKNSNPARYDSLSDNWSVESCEDLTDGRALCFILAFYYPNTFPIHDVETGEDLAIADCLYNLSIFYKFCSQHIFSKKLLAINVNDLFYAHNELSINIFSFLAELFLVIDILPVISTFPMPSQIDDVKTIEDNIKEQPIIKKNCPSSILLPKRQKTFNSLSNVFNIKNESKTKQRIKSANLECRETLQIPLNNLRKETIPQAWEKDKMEYKSGKKYFPEIDNEVENIKEEQIVHKNNGNNNVTNSIKDEKIDPKKSYTIISKTKTEGKDLSHYPGDANSSLILNKENEKTGENINKNSLDENITFAENLVSCQNGENDVSKNQTNQSHNIGPQTKINGQLNQHILNSKDAKTRILSEKMYQSECFSKPIAKSIINNKDLGALNLSRGFATRGTYKITKECKEEKLRKSLKHDLLSDDEIKGKDDISEKVLKQIDSVIEDKFDEGNEEIKNRILNDITIKTNEEPNISAVNEDSTPTEEYELASSDPTMWVTALDDASYEQDSLIPAQTSFINIANSIRSSQNISHNNNVHISPKSPEIVSRNNPMKSITFITTNSSFNKTSWASIAENQKKIKNPNKVINENNVQNFDKLAAKQQLVVKMDMEAKRRRIKEEWNLLQQSKKLQHENIGKKAFINTILNKNEHNKSTPTDTNICLENKFTINDNQKVASSKLDHSPEYKEKLKLLQTQTNHNEDDINTFDQKLAEFPQTKLQTGASITTKGLIPEPLMVSENNFSSRFTQSPQINELDEGFEKLRSEIKRLSVEQDNLKNYVNQISHNKSDQDSGAKSPMNNKMDIIIPQFNGNLAYDQYKSFIDSPYLNSSAKVLEDEQRKHLAFQVSKSINDTQLLQHPNFSQYPLSNIRTLVEQGSYNPTFVSQSVSTNFHSLVEQPACNLSFAYGTPQSTNNFVPTCNLHTSAFTRSISNIDKHPIINDHSAGKLIYNDNNVDSKYSNVEISDNSSLNPVIECKPKDIKVFQPISEIDVNMRNSSIAENELFAKPAPNHFKHLKNNNTVKAKEFFIDIRSNNENIEFPENEIKLKETFRTAIEMSDDINSKNVNKTCEKINIAIEQRNKFITEISQKMNQLELQDDRNNINDNDLPQVEDIETNNKNLVAPMAFVVGQLSSENVQLEKDHRRQMITQQLEQRRREERERKRQIVEEDRDKKKDIDRQRREEQDKRRLEEKTKREAVFKNYLQRKVEVNENVTVASPTQSSPLQTLNRKQQQSKKKLIRPISQQIISSAGSENGIEIEDLEPANCPNSPTIDIISKRNRQTPDRPIKFTGHANSDNAVNNHHAEAYSGPKLYVKPSQKSNKSLIENALSKNCLAGAVNEPVKLKVLEELGKSDGKHFIILFREGALHQFRGLYTYNFDTGEILRIQGIGPKQILNNQIVKFYKYNSGTKSFIEVSSTKHVSATIDAITIGNGVWQRKQPLMSPST